MFGVCVYFSVGVIIFECVFFCVRWLFFCMSAFCVFMWCVNDYA